MELKVNTLFVKSYRHLASHAVGYGAKWLIQLLENILSSAFDTDEARHCKNFGDGEKWHPLYCARTTTLRYILNSDVITLWKTFSFEERKWNTNVFKSNHTYSFPKRKGIAQQINPFSVTNTWDDNWKSRLCRTLKHKKYSKVLAENVSQLNFFDNSISCEKSPVTWHFTPKTFHPGTFNPGTFHPTYISPHVRFTPRTFHPTYVSPHVRFTPRTFHPTYVSPHVHFTPRTFHPRDMSLRIK